MRSRVVFAFSAATSLAALVIAFSAGAAVTEGDTPAPRVASPARDVNGVDMVTGQFSVGSPFLIQAPADPRLALRNSVGPHLYTHSLVPTLSETATDVGGYAYEVTVTAGGQPRKFACDWIDPTSGYICSENDGTTLTVPVFNYTASTLKADPRQYEFTDRDGTVYRFKSNFNPKFYSDLGSGRGEILSVVYPEGETWTFASNIFNYLPTITSNLGYGVTGRSLYKGTTLLGGVTVTETDTVTLDTVVETDTLGRTFTAVWDHYTCSAGSGSDHGSVVSMTSPGGVTTTLTYGINPIWNASGTVRTIYNDRYVATVTRGGKTWTYGATYVTSPGSSLGNGTLTATDPLSHLTTVKSTADAWDSLGDTGINCAPSATRGQVTQVTDPLGRVSEYQYAGEHVIRAVLPEDNEQLYGYDARGNLTSITRKRKPGSTDVADNVVIYQASFDTSCTNRKTCNQPNWTKDALGNQTDYTYVTWGGVATQTLPADQNGLRQRTYNTYTAYTTASGSIIYRLTRTEVCGLSSTQLTLTACPTGPGTATTTEVTVIDYGTSTTAPNTYNTFLPYTTTQTDGAGSLSATTTYTYDAWGRVTAVDGPLSGTGDTSYTTYDAAGRKICEIGPDPDGGGSLVRAMVRHTYNADDQETKTETGTGTSTTACVPGSSMTVSSFSRMTYDSLGRLVKTEAVQP